MQAKKEKKLSSKIWNFFSPPENLVEEISKSFQLHPIIAKVIVNRGFENFDDIQKFLYGKLSDIYDPFLMKEMDQAVERIIRAIVQREKIVIYGDYDVDGVTSVALFSNLFLTLKADYEYYLPNRITEGYGLSYEGISRCHANRGKLLISVDCGVCSNNEVAYARSLGMDVIVTDHHEPGRALPECAAVLDPKRQDDAYPYKDLAGVGVTFKLAHAIASRAVEKGIIEKDEIRLKDMLDLVALGTVADSVPLLDENRILVKYGLRQINRVGRVGLQELGAVSNVDENITSYDIAYRLAPRLNAVGRLGDAHYGVELLMSEDEKEAFHLATMIEEKNRKRQLIEQEIFKEVEEKISKSVDLHNAKIIILDSENWHQGVVPIVASRIAKTYYRPTVIIAVEEGVGKGSARSVEEFDILECLKKSEDILENFGGHRSAAGFQVKAENISLLRSRLSELATSELGEVTMTPKINIDSEIDLSEVTVDFIKLLRILEPFGHGNPRPVFATKDVFLKWAPKIVGSNHLKLWFDAKDRVVEGIGFSMGGLLPRMKDTDVSYDVVYIPRTNYFRGEEIVELYIRDIRCSATL